MDKNTENYYRGSMGDQFASGWGQVGYEINKQKQDRERAQLRKIGEDDRGSHNSSGNGSMKGLVQFALVLVAIEAFMNFTGYLVSDFQRIAAFIGAISSLVVVHVYWELIIKILITAILIIGGVAGFDTFISN